MHKREIDLVGPNQFLRKSLQSIKMSDIAADNGVFAQQALVAAQEVEQGFDMRLKDHQSRHGALRWHMHSAHLPLASQTQFVESSVKDAVHVSHADRSEHHHHVMLLFGVCPHSLKWRRMPM